jgi:RNase H-fold protein (predicted Holliday junction resolvase)
MSFIIISICKHTKKGTPLNFPRAKIVDAIHSEYNAREVVAALKKHIDTKPKPGDFAKVSHYEKALRKHNKNHPIQKKSLRGEEYAVIAEDEDNPII